MATPKKTDTKKITPKKTSVKKATAKKPVIATSETSKAAVSSKKSSPTTGLMIAIVILVGFIFGLLSWISMGGSSNALQTTSTDSKVVRMNGNTYVSVKNLEDEFKVEVTENQELVVFGGKTWIPVPGKPVEVVVLSDENCGANCNPEAGLGIIRQNITPALITRVVDIASTEGKDLVEKFEILKIPAYFLGEGADSIQTPTGEALLPLLGSILSEKDGLHYFTAQSGLPSSKFISAPAIDTKGEPQIGTGAIKVIEFTDYQCPYCKSLHDKNKDLLQEMVDNGTITYVLKDFPLAFHTSAPATHAAANCVLEDAGNEAYFAMKAAIFDNQQAWGQKSGADLEAYLVELAQAQGADITSCINDEAVRAEIDADMAEGSKYGVSGTPGLFVGSQFIPGAIGADQMRAAIEAEMK